MEDKFLCETFLSSFLIVKVKYLKFQLGKDKETAERNKFIFKFLAEMCFICCCNGLKSKFIEMKNLFLVFIFNVRTLKMKRVEKHVPPMEALIKTNVLS